MQSKLTTQNHKLTTSLFIVICLLFSIDSYSQGRWIKVAAPSPDYNNGVLILMSDGSVLAKSCAGGTDTIGEIWNKLTPDTNGSYVNGHWSRIATMNDRRLYMSSQLLRDGRLYVAGGEYGTGSATGEIYNPLTNKWTMTGNLPGGYRIYDGNSALLPDGRILQGIVFPDRATCIYNPITNTFVNGPASLSSHDEAAWQILPDNSILFVDLFSKRSERYIPSSNSWVRDDSLPVLLYDKYGKETGASLLLPDGRAFYIGSTSTTAYYTPSGSTAPGSWAAGPVIPDSAGAPDASAAMMADGNILCAFSHTPVLGDTFPSPTMFYIFNYRTNSFTRIPAPDGNDTLAGACYTTGMVDLPDGNVLFASLASNTYYIYQPEGPQVTSGKPQITNITKIDCDKYLATGHLFNGISQGASYGDDWQMNSNYPIVRLSIENPLYGKLVYYARTYNWNSSGVMRGTAIDSTNFTLPDGLPDGTYQLQVIANGTHSDAQSFTTCNTVAVNQEINATNAITIFPNPATDEATLLFGSISEQPYKITITDMPGRIISYMEGNTVSGNNRLSLDLRNLNKGMYIVTLQQGNTLIHTRIIKD